MDPAIYQQHRFRDLTDAVGVASFSLLSGMGGSLGQLNSQLAELRATNSAQLAVQKVMLDRDELQQHLEELIHQGQKMVDWLSSQSDTMPVVQKALLIRSFYLCVTKAGIGTEMIRGLENKKAFDLLIRQVKSVVEQLGRDPSVCKAVALEEAAEKGQLALETEEQQRRLEEQRLNAPVAITVARTGTATGGMYKVEVKINGRRVGTISGDESLEVRLRPGSYTMDVAGGGLSKSLKFTVVQGEPRKFEMYFSTWGILGGGLVVRPAHGIRSTRQAAE